MSLSLPAQESILEIVRDPLRSARELAARGVQDLHRFLANPLNRAEVECALRIRAVETGLYALFGRGKLHGTIHTCVGQEFSGVLAAKQLRAGDFVTSNHRCHGHFIAAGNDWRALIDELIGNADGVCAGIGSSQHLWAENFISNGQQGGLLPVAAGVAFDRQLKGRDDVVVSFIGEGTLGEGIVYETLNLASLWSLPHVVVCENNFYSQSTPQPHSVAGVIAERAASFGLSVATASTWDLAGYEAAVSSLVERARAESRPGFLVLSTYRLNPHSKGDDQRDAGEIGWFRSHDPVEQALGHYDGFASVYAGFEAEVEEHIAKGLEKAALDPALYFVSQLPEQTAPEAVVWKPVQRGDGEGARVAQQLNAFFRDWMAADEDVLFVGEDIADPYGGAFKVAKGLTTAFPERARTTPISEAAITGVGVGLAISGRRPLVEIMFGDFVTYAFDQIVNNASKMFHMYNQRLDCPLVVRMPMGGRRGYGPTHSQSLERFLIGIDNVTTVSLNSLASAAAQLEGLKALRCPVILLENKSDYGQRTFEAPEGLVVEQDAASLPTLRVRPAETPAGVTIVAYGGMARFVADALIEIFEETDVVPELVAPTSLSPLNLAPILESVGRTGRLLVVEEGASTGSVGAELVAQLGEAMPGRFTAARLGGKPMPIPSAPALEAAALPSVAAICDAVTRLCAS